MQNIAFKDFTEVDAANCVIRLWWNTYFGFYEKSVHSRDWCSEAKNRIGIIDTIFEMSKLVVSTETRLGQHGLLVCWQDVFSNLIRLAQLVRSYL